MYSFSSRTDLETNLAQSSKNITTELCVISITERRRSTLYYSKDKKFLIGTKNQTFITFIAFYSVKWYCSQSYVTVQAIFTKVAKLKMRP